MTSPLTSESCWLFNVELRGLQERHVDLSVQELAAVNRL